MASLEQRIRRRGNVVTLVATETRPQAWGGIGRLQPRTFDRLLVGLLLLLGLTTSLDLRFADRGLPLGTRTPGGAPTAIAVGLAVLLLQA
jgi:hypothetical protein